MKNLFLGMAAMAAVLTTSAKAETINCTEITTVPMVITRQGVYCLKHDLSSALASGNMIDIQTNNVTIDLNGFKLGGLGAGPNTLAIGIHAEDRKNITIRNGSVRGFLDGVVISGASSSGDLVEDLLLDGNRSVGLSVRGLGHIVRNNRVVNTGPGGSNTEADAIFVGAQHSVIADNVISGVSETGFAVGIRVFGSSLVDVRGNNIFGVEDATNTRGIEVNSSTTITVINNRVLNLPSALGGVGIFNSGSVAELGCIDNTVSGYTTALSGCNISPGNNMF